MRVIGRKALATIITALALAVAARGAQAQTLREPEARQGFYISAGAGVSALAAWDKGQRDATAAGSAKGSSALSGPIPPWNHTTIGGTAEMAATTALFHTARTIAPGPTSMIRPRNR